MNMPDGVLRRAQSSYFVPKLRRLPTLGVSAARTPCQGVAAFAIMPFAGQDVCTYQRFFWKMTGGVSWSLVPTSGLGFRAMHASMTAEMPHGLLPPRLQIWSEPQPRGIEAGLPDLYTLMYERFLKWTVRAAVSHAPPPLLQACHRLNTLSSFLTNISGRICCV